MELTLSIMSKDFWVGTIFGVVILGAVSTYLVRGLDHFGPKVMGLLAKHAKGLSAWAVRKMEDLKSPENAAHLARLKFRAIRMKIDCVIFMMMGSLMIGLLRINPEAPSSLLAALCAVIGVFFIVLSLSYWLRAEWCNLLVDLSELGEKLKFSNPGRDPKED